MDGSPNFQDSEDNVDPSSGTVEEVSSPDDAISESLSYMEDSSSDAGDQEQSPNAMSISPSPSEGEASSSDAMDESSPESNRASPEAEEAQGAVNPEYSSPELEAWLPDASPDPSTREPVDDDDEPEEFCMYVSRQGEFKTLYELLQPGSMPPTSFTAPGKARGVVLSHLNQSESHDNGKEPVTDRPLGDLIDLVCRGVASIETSIAKLIIARVYGEFVMVKKALQLLARIQSPMFNDLSENDIVNIIEGERAPWISIYRAVPCTATELVALCFLNKRALRHASQNTHILEELKTTLQILSLGRGQFMKLPANKTLGSPGVENASLSSDSVEWVPKPDGNTTVTITSTAISDYFRQFTSPTIDMQTDSQSCIPGSQYSENMATVPMELLTRSEAYADAPSLVGASHPGSTYATSSPPQTSMRRSLWEAATAVDVSSPALSPASDPLVFTDFLDFGE
ncbi:hypothetical protein QFC21_006945 [Naganishia friedmannii]|uniref:Uncharacterized protein n=1 Tax=Naganishia friedmannii TaxID=89922 RepID=A0ACC2UYP0_9TREE|nr:hypothetical protein QFC21_006945 [Naganishia friedmannii]